MKTVFAILIVIFSGSALADVDYNRTYPNCEITAAKKKYKNLISGVNRHVLCKDTVYALTGSTCPLLSQYKLELNIVDTEMYAVMMEALLVEERAGRKKSKLNLYNAYAVMTWNPDDDYVTLSKEFDSSQLIVDYSCYKKRD